TNEGFELINTPVVIGENITQRMEATDLKLDIPAIKIRDINTKIQNIQTEIIDDRIIIQGILNKQIFYVGTDEIIHHQSENIDFCTFIDVPGAEPGMELLIEPTVEHTIGKLTAEGNILQQKDVIQFFVKVLSLHQLIIEVGSGPLVKVNRVIGENTYQSIIMNSVALAVEANKIVDFTAEVKELETEIIDDNLVIQGIVHKQLYYTGKDGSEHHQEEDIPFSELANFPGVEPGMNVQVNSTVEQINQELKYDRINVSQEIIIELFVKVSEKLQLNVVTGDDSMVMLPEVIGENVKQIFSETALKLEQDALKIKDITALFKDIDVVILNDRVIVQGIVHKKIYYLGKDNIEYQQVENIPFSTFVNIMGAKPGMNVDVIPTIALTKPVLSGNGELLSQKLIGDIFVKVTDNIQFRVSEAEPYEK
ncbi:MAG: DUF3794 domain-containing protein, partial [Halanaerobiales bacterium]